MEVIISEEIESQYLIAALAQGELDLAFVLNPQPDERVEIFPLVEDPWVILTPRDNPISEDPHPSFDILDGARLIVWQRRWRTQVQLEELLARRGINPVFVHRTDDNLSLQRLVAVGLGHACVSRIAARNAFDNRLTWLEPREELVRRQTRPVLPTGARGVRRGHGPRCRSPRPNQPLVASRPSFAVSVLKLRRVMRKPQSLPGH